MVTRDARPQGQPQTLGARNSWANTGGGGRARVRLTRRGRRTMCSPTRFPERGYRTGRAAHQSYGRVTGHYPKVGMYSRRAAIPEREGTILASYWTSTAPPLPEAAAETASRSTRAALTSQNGREYDCTRRATGMSGGLGAQVCQTGQPTHTLGWNTTPQVSMEDEAK